MASGGTIKMASGVVRTSTGLNALLTAHFLGTSNAPANTQFGTGTTTPSVSDTTIETQAGSDTSIETDYPTVSGLTAELRTVLGTTALNSNDLTEFTVIDGDDNLQLHAVFSPQTKTSSGIFIAVNKTKIRNRGGNL